MTTNRGNGSDPQDPFIEKIFNTETVRSTSQKIAELCKSGSTHFLLHEDRLPQVADYVISLIKDRYPDLDVPYHSRWRHFEVGERTELKSYFELIKGQDIHERARIGLDLIIPSVLVDAGAGPDWQYVTSSSTSIGRSEGLAIASLDAFLAGAFSRPKEIATNASGLDGITLPEFNTLFQVSESNPMLGVAGRVELLNNLASVLTNKPEIFKNQRPGGLVDYILANIGNEISAQQVLNLIIASLGDIWPGRLQFNDTNLGDTWAYKPLGKGVDGYVPFHKLSQWLTYSVIETLENSGFAVSGLSALTGLAEYRNGGLMIDSGLLELRDASDANQQWPASSELIIEWRALTIYLLDKLGQSIRSKLNLTDLELPLAKVLEGGTWFAGRKLAVEKRGSSTPPIDIISDGTVF